MQHAYNELYLNKARTSLAMMLDHAVRDLRLDADRFFDLFISSGTAEQFGRGDFRIIAGMSGIELVYHVLAKSGMAAERGSYRYTSSRSKEYWAGWAAAQYQWERAITFADIIDSVPVREIIAIAGEYREAEISALSEGLSWMDTVAVPDHMNPENYSELAARLDTLILKSSGPTALGSLRMLSGFSQSRLASVSGVPVRTIQQYEQRQKDINKASIETIIKLAASLSCQPSDLLEHHTE